MDASDFSAYKLELFRPSHYPAFQILFENAFHTRLSIEDIKSRFATKNLGSEAIGYIALHIPDNMPAAYYGVLPVNALFDGKMIRAVQSCDTMTHSDHRGKGLFVKLANLTFEECKKREIQFVFGQPNQSSYPGFVKYLNWQHLDDIVRWDLKQKIKTFPLPKILTKLGLFERLFIPYAQIVLGNMIVQEPVSFINKIESDYGKILREPAYLQYKKSKDKFFIEVDGIIFWIKLIDVFWIGDLSDYRNISENTIKKIMKIAFKLGYNTVIYNINRSIRLPFLHAFKENSSQASCLLYFNDELKEKNILLTGADSDTW